MNQPINIIILAGGMGKRMQSAVPKPLQTFAGDTLLNRVVKTAYQTQPERVVVVYPPSHETTFKASVDRDVIWVPQHNPKGTGHAVLEALPACHENAKIIVLLGDVPLVSAELIHQLSKIKSMSVVSYITTQPDGFGRLVMDGKRLIKIVEHKDATLEQRNIQEIFSGILSAPKSFLEKYLPCLDTNNQQNEMYFTDCIEKWATDYPEPIEVIRAKTWDEIAGLNTPRQLIELERRHYLHRAYEFIDQGIFIRDPARFDCKGDVQIKKGCVIDINVILEGNVVLEEGCYVGPHCILKDCTVGKNTRIEAYTHVESSQIGQACSLGPYARIRPECNILDQSKVGNFVEMKKTTLGPCSKASHLSYLGDANIHENVNIGAGTITCNYDGQQKHTTVIEKDSFVGSNSSLVAPIIIAENSTIGAGSVITQNTQKNALSLSRIQQKSVKDWSLRKKSKKKHIDIQ